MSQEQRRRKNKLCGMRGKFKKSFMEATTCNPALRNTQLPTKRRQRKGILGREDSTGAVYGALRYPQIWGDPQHSCLATPHVLGGRERQAREEEKLPWGEAEHSAGVQASFYAQ